mgnify:CR=1 FL=1
MNRALPNLSVHQLLYVHEAARAPTWTEAAHRLCPHVADADRARLLVPRCGHFSLFHGRPCRETVIPALTAFWGGLRAPGRSLSHRKDNGRRKVKLAP